MDLNILGIEKTNVEFGLYEFDTKEFTMHKVDKPPGFGEMENPVEFIDKIILKNGGNSMEDYGGKCL